MSKFQEKILKTKQEYKSYRAEQIYKTFEEVKEIESKRGKEISPDTRKAFDLGSTFQCGIGYNWFQKIAKFAEQNKAELSPNQYKNYIGETVLNYNQYKAIAYSADASKDRLLSSIKNQELSTKISVEELNTLAEITLENCQQIYNGNKTFGIVKDLSLYKEFYINQIKQAEEDKNDDLVIGCKNILLKIIYNTQEYANYHNAISKNYQSLSIENQPSILSLEEIEWVTDQNSELLNNNKLNQEEISLIGDSDV
jgi:hypothetical protein